MGQQRWRLAPFEVINEAQPWDVLPVPAASERYMKSVSLCHPRRSLTRRGIGRDADQDRLRGLQAEHRRFCSQCYVYRVCEVWVILDQREPIFAIGVRPNRCSTNASQYE